MFIAKRLKEMALPGLTFGEHCVNYKAQLFLRKVSAFLRGRQIDTVFMRNPG